jgi:hypothetical protein
MTFILLCAIVYGVDGPVVLGVCCVSCYDVSPLLLEFKSSRQPTQIDAHNATSFQNHQAKIHRPIITEIEHHVKK